MKMANKGWFEGISQGKQKHWRKIKKTKIFFFYLLLAFIPEKMSYVTAIKLKLNYQGFWFWRTVFLLYLNWGEDAHIWLKERKETHT